MISSGYFHGKMTFGSYKREKWVGMGVLPSDVITSRSHTAEIIAQQRGKRQLVFLHRRCKTQLLGIPQSRSKVRFRLILFCFLLLFFFCLKWTISLVNDEIGERMISESRSHTRMRSWKLNRKRVKFLNGVCCCNDYDRFQLLQWV